MRGFFNPLFAMKKISSSYIEHLLAQALCDQEDFFVLKIVEKEACFFKVVIDGFKGVPLSVCVRLNRFLMRHFETFEMGVRFEVTTPDISDSICDKRQYAKNIGRMLAVDMVGGATVSGQLLGVKSEGILLGIDQQKAKLKKGQQKKTVLTQQLVSYENIDKATVIIQF